VTLQWASYYDAADQVGLSRIWGGIHPPADDLAGRRVGAQTGARAWALAKSYFDGSVTNTAVHLATRKLDANSVEIRHNAVRGMYYKVHSAQNVEGPYTHGGGAGQLALEASVITTNALNTPQKFFRVSGSLSP
jgi:hypothetical protein